MGNRYVIISAPADFYIGDALCRKLEQDGETCFFNLRESNRANEPADVLAKTEEKAVCVLVVNEEAIKDEKYFSLCSSLMSRPATRNWKFFLLRNGNISDYPENWDNCIAIDATTGLTQATISIIRKGLKELSKPQFVLEVKDSSKEKEKQDFAQQNNYRVSNPKNTESRGISNEKENSGDMQAPPSQEEVKTVSGTAKNDTQLENGLQDLSFEERGDNHQSYSGYYRDFSRPTEGGYEKFAEILRASAASLPTVMTKKPTDTDDDYFDEVSEAYMVPLYVLPFERCETIPDIAYLFDQIDNPSLTIQRAFRYLIGDGVPQDDKRAYSLFKKAEGEDSSEIVAKYCLAVCHQAGIGVTENRHISLQLFKEAHERGYLPATTSLASLLYFNGNRNAAKVLLQEAREHEVLDASYMLGVIAEDEGEYEEAQELYSEAAELGHIKAQIAIAAMYYNGVGVERNEDIAYQWLHQTKTDNFIGTAYNDIVFRLNRIDKALPEFKELEDMFLQVKGVQNQFKKMEIFLRVVPLMYNLAILVRRANVDMESIEGILVWPKDVELPYVKDFYDYFEIEEKRRQKKARTMKALSFINEALKRANRQ